MRKVDYSARYASDYNHWLRQLSQEYLLGLTDWAQYTLGEITGLQELPSPGSFLEKGKPYLLIESAKASTELVAPIHAQILAINEQLFKQPSLINSNCYDEGWLLKISLTDEKDWLNLKTAEAYKAGIDSLFRK